MKEENMTQNKRFFAFGCSYTDYVWPTWADIIGVNFDVYENYGRGGASNLYILQKFLEANDTYKFNENDFIVVMFTGFGRFSYFKNGKMQTDGEIRSYFYNTQKMGTPDESIGKFIDGGVWSEDLGVTNSFISANTIKNLLTYINCSYELHLSIDNTHFIKEPHRFFLAEESLYFAERFYDVLDVKTSVDEFLKSTYSNDDYYVFGDNGRDGHPTIQMHADYAKKYFPQYYTHLSDNFVNEEKEKMIFTKWTNQRSEYDDRKRFRKLHKL